METENKTNNEIVVYKLPISYGREANVVSNAFVDKDLLPYLAKFKWFLSDTKRARTPKTQMRIKGQPKSMLLNRVVFTLEALSDEQRAKLTDRINVEVLYALVERQPKLKYKRQDPFDCRIDNIEVAAKGLDESIFATHEEAEELGFEDNAVSASEAEQLKQMLDKRAEDLKRKQLEDEQRRREVPDDVLGTDPLGLMKQISREQIEQSNKEQQDLLNNVFDMVSRPKDTSKPGPPPPGVTL